MLLEEQYVIRVSAFHLRLRILIHRNLEQSKTIYLRTREPVHLSPFQNALTISLTLFHRNTEQVVIHFKQPLSTFVGDRFR